MIDAVINIFVYLLLFFSINIGDYKYPSNNNSYFELNIPSIDLYKEVYNYSDKNNDVNKGIYLVNNYDLNSLNGTLILASHSGSSSISYFKHLDKLNKNDLLYLTYNGYDYYYKINDIFKINKTGKFKYKDKNKTIYLITCDKKNKKKQIVFYGKLMKIVKKSSFF